VDALEERTAAFAEAYLRRSPLDPSVPQVAAEVRGALEFAASRGRAPVAVRALNPTLEEHGYQPAGSVLETNTDDLPFLVDSVTAELHARGLGIARVQHPILGEPPNRESVMHFELDRRLAPEELAALEDAVREVLSHVRRVVSDFPQIDARVAALAERVIAAGGEDADEAARFIAWLRDEHFIFLGYRDGETALGLPLEAGEANGSGALHIGKAAALSPVHRRARMDLISVGGAHIAGLFTTRAYAEAAATTPVLARKLQQILGGEDLIEGSHDYKAAVALFESFPKDELFAAPTEDLRGALVALLHLQPDRVGVLSRVAADERSASVVVALPRARLSPQLIERVQRLLVQRFGASDAEVHEILDADQGRLHFALHLPDGPSATPDTATLQQEIAELARTWEDRLREHLVAAHGAERGRILAARWSARLPDSYKAFTRPSLAVHDVDGFEQLHVGAEDIVVGIQDEGATRTRIGLYKRGAKAELGRVMPILEDLGLRVVEERPTRLDTAGGGEETWLQDFGVLGPEDEPLDLDAVGSRVAECIVAVWQGLTESDSLNRLVVVAGLNWRQINVLRAYRRYRQRIGSRFTEGYQNDVIAANPHITAKLMLLFEQRFDPARAPDPDADAALRAAILADLEDVASLDHDRILRNQLGLIEATVRTNAYKPGREVIAFKLRSADVPAIPTPAPLFEIYVYSPEMEGIHLRGGRIARGGLRWSDRQDYRTEVYGLMRAQMTKNAVIVPAGAKGGFYLKAPPAEPGALRDEVKRQYVRYIGGLLDLTDNLVDGAVVQPEGVRVLDEDDTYLVVAADKGTATFSDTANGVAESRGFWLGDAFASGGSKGYDHKALGITARGAWESLKRHFSELDLDPAVDEFTAVGIGDMSGDVFGNGMLLSDKIRLVAAYDHRHVFLDPSPGDPAASFAERQRLFELAGSSWDDYARELISKGGGVFPRSAKSIPLTPQVREALGVDAEALPPNDVISAILRAPVDVLWNGGIGTVVKASTESHDDALDRSSDAIRVDARDLRCRVVAEGGNLGLTQRARIEFARGGGLVNADFIDNSAGVDCSDHEVNLKILLGLAVTRGELDGPGRDAALAEVTEDVAAHVLYDSFLQAQILAQEVRGSAQKTFAYEDLMALLESEDLLDRAAEFAPSSEEMSERRRTGAGLERPELAVLLAYAKRHLTDALLHSDLLDDPFLARDLEEYFPPAIVERFGHLLIDHPLRRELLATLSANKVVNGLGPSFASRLMAERGAPAAEVVRAFRIAVEVTWAEDRWLAVERLDRSVPREVVWELMDGIDWLVEAAARWYLANAIGADITTAVELGRESFRRIFDVLPELGDEEWRTEREATAQRLRDAGVPDGLAQAHAFQPGLAHAPDMISAAAITGRPVEDVGRAFYRIGDGVRLEWLEKQVLAQPAQSRTQRWALHALLEDLLLARRELSLRALKDHPDLGPTEAVEAFLEHRREARERYERFLRALTAEGGVDLAGLTLASRMLRGLVD
jgi:glutamate dehydrogenase